MDVRQLSFVCFTVLTISGCLDRDLRPLTPCVVSGVVQTVKVSNIDKVDVLFMVDNSDSMKEEQTALAREFPKLVTALASGDANGDGTQDFPPVKDLHVGVVSSDMGAGGFHYDTCTTDFGDDGILQTKSRVNPADPDLRNCMTTDYPKFLTFMNAGGPPSSAALAKFAQDFTCVARLGTGGCGLEQQLESPVKALTPSTVKRPFFRMTVGHGDMANAGFLRPDSLLAVIVTSDENDCSASDFDLFNPDSTRYSDNLNTRCARFPQALRPVRGDSAGSFSFDFLALRNDPDLLVYAAITGIPTDLAVSPRNCGSNADCGKAGICVRNVCEADFKAINMDPRMQEVVDPTTMMAGDRLIPSCNTMNGLAYPPRRMVELAGELELKRANAVVQSICQSNFSPALDAIIRKIGDVLGRVCLPRPLNPDSEGKVNCDVTETLPVEGPYTRCDQLTSIGREPNPIRLEKAENGRTQQVCRVNQVVVNKSTCKASDPGWFYDTCSPDLAEFCKDRPQRISFVPGSEPKTGSLVRLECLQSLASTSKSNDEAVLGTVCTPGSSGDALCAGSRLVKGMICDPVTRTCERQCTTDADCVELGNFLCDTHADSSGRRVCVNPTCGQTQ